MVSSLMHKTLSLQEKLRLPPPNYSNEQRQKRKQGDHKSRPYELKVKVVRAHVRSVADDHERGLRRLGRREHTPVFNPEAISPDPPGDSAAWDALHAGTPVLMAADAIGCPSWRRSTWYAPGLRAATRTAL